MTVENGGGELAAEKSYTDVVEELPFASGGAQPDRIAEAWRWQKM